MRRLVCFLVMVTLPLLAYAEDARLAALRTTLLSLRRPASENFETRGATPAFTVVKHQLREWIESRLSTSGRDRDAAVFAGELNGALRDAGLFCNEEAQCPEGTLLGFLGKIEIVRRSEFLLVYTGVGIQQCGVDQSAYLYEWSGTSWRRKWENEQVDYSERVYKPQAFADVLVTPFSRAGRYLILTLGTKSWCSSSWHPVYFRMWRMYRDASGSKLLAEGEELAFLDGSPNGAVGENDVLIEYTIGSRDAGVHSRQVVRKYVVEGDQVTRVDPVALGPRDFVDEWLVRPWTESAKWSEPSARASLSESHTQHRAIFGEFLHPTRHCPKTPDLWQVGIDFENGPTYFLVRWRPPYHFTMVQISDHPSPGCTEKDHQADERRTLFPAVR